MIETDCELEHQLVKKVLVVKTHAIGDVLLVTPAIRAIRKAYPDAIVHFWAGQWSAKALDHNDNIDKIIRIPDEVLFKFRPLQLINSVVSLRKEHYDLVVIFQPSLKIQLLMKLTGAKAMAAPVNGLNLANIGYRSSWRTDRDRYVAEDFLDIVRTIGIPSDGVEIDFPIPPEIQQRVASEIDTSIKDNNPIVILCPGGGTNPRDYVAQKIWPAKLYSVLSQRLINDGCHIVVSGIESERNSLREVLEVPNVMDYIGRMNLVELGAWMTQSNICVTNDSAPLHIAVASSCPTVAIFGPSRKNALIPESGHLIAVESEVFCAPCYDNEPFPGCPRCDCIQSISVDRVYQAVKDALKLWTRRKK